MNIDIHPSRTLGPIKPLHGVGGGPVTEHFSMDARRYFTEAGFPFGRTHDIEYPFGSGEFVDIHCIFPDPRADVNDPGNYNFVFTDEYLRYMLSCGTKPFYRLGSTIEHQPIKRYINPPQDPVKWGEICSHIIAHYNKGWANGYEWNVEYWEIWNEPDIPQCWTGTQEEFFALYDAAAAVIKRDHPNVKLGGIALTSPYSGMFEPFLAHVNQSGAPLDFVSWHGYCHTPEQAADYAARAQSLMEKYGFGDRESICDEWNYVRSWSDLQPDVDLHPTAYCAAFVAGVLSAVQNTSVTKLMYYDVQITGELFWNGVFRRTRAKQHAAMRQVQPEKCYYPLYAWNRLYKAGTQVGVSSPEHVYVTAAVDNNGTLLVYLSHFDEADTDRELSLTLTVDGRPLKNVKLWRVDDKNSYEPDFSESGNITLRTNSFLLAEIQI